MDPLGAALATAAATGLDASAAAVLRDLGSTVVHLRPSPVVARVAAADEADAVRREVAVAGYLAARGGPVVAPYAGHEPVVVDGHVVSLWDLVDHDPDRPLDGVAAGRALRQVHELLAGYPDAEALPHFARLAEVRGILDALDPALPEQGDLATMLSLAEQHVAALDVPLQAVHGDAWLGNVLRTPDGPLWSDFERACRGPRELDLACNETAARQRGRRPVDDHLLAGYGGYDADVMARVAVVEMVPLTAWTFRLAMRQATYLDPARERLALALEGLRSPPAG